MNAERRWIGYAAVAVLAAVTLAFSGPFGQELTGEIAIFALFVLSIGFLGGIAGLVSFGHALFYGVGGYATAWLVVKAGWWPGAAMLAVVVLGIVLAAGVGFLVVNTRGTIFIMVTLALAMMFYAWVVKSPVFNGADGLAGVRRVDLSMVGWDSVGPAGFASLAVALALAGWIGLDQIIRSPFGQALEAIRQNEARMRALGCPVFAYKLAAFTLSGTLATIAGSLSAQHTGLVSPEIAHWFVSGDGLIAAIIGGFHSMAGAVIGTILLLVAKHEMSNFTQHWFLFLGVFFIVLVLVAPEGVVGRLGALRVFAKR